MQAAKQTTQRKIRIAGIDIVVLAGGLGTRLRSVLPDQPKILAPINGEPYVVFLLDWLRHEGARNVIFSLGFKAGQVEEYIRGYTGSLALQSSVEPEPAGTAGALRYVHRLVASDPVMVMNGDSFVDADLNDFAAFHAVHEFPISVLCVSLPDVSRYGRVEIGSNNAVTRFAEKDPAYTGAGTINAGVYLFDKAMLDDIVADDATSLERDVFAVMTDGRIGAYVVDGTFLDIGTPESLAAAGEILSPYRRERQTDL